MLNTQCLYVGKSGEVLKVKEKHKVVQKIRLKDVSQVNLMGAVQLSTQAVQGLVQAEIPLLYFSMGGWFYGMTQSVGLKNMKQNALIRCRHCWGSREWQLVHTLKILPECLRLDVLASPTRNSP